MTAAKDDLLSVADLLPNGSLCCASPTLRLRRDGMFIFVNHLILLPLCGNKKASLKLMTVTHGIERLMIANSLSDKGGKYEKQTKSRSGR